MSSIRTGKTAVQVFPRRRYGVSPLRNVLARVSPATLIRPFTGCSLILLHNSFPACPAQRGKPVLSTSLVKGLACRSPGARKVRSCPCVALLPMRKNSRHRAKLRFSPGRIFFAFQEPEVLGPEARVLAQAAPCKTTLSNGASWDASKTTHHHVPSALNLPHFPVATGAEHHSEEAAPSTATRRRA